MTLKPLTEETTSNIDRVADDMVRACETKISRALTMKGFMVTTIFDDPNLIS